jgi:hypothetical protein
MVAYNFKARLPRHEILRLYHRLDSSAGGSAMSLEAHLAPLTRAELVQLLVQVGPGLLDEQDIARARWHAALEEGKRLEKVAADLADTASQIDAECTTSNSARNLNRLRDRDQARHAYRVARAAADRHYRREQKRWEEFQRFSIKDAK